MAGSGAISLLSWNVNSLRVRLPQVLRYLETHAVDIVCLQETRVGAEAFPRKAFEALGYEVAAVGEGGYAGVAIASRLGIDERFEGINGFLDERRAGRRLLCRIDGRWIDNVYVPTRKAIGKVAFLEALRCDHVARFEGEDEVVLAGDFNLCFDRRDLASPKMISESELHPARSEDLAFRRLIESARLNDCFRRRTSDAGHYSWFPLTRWALKRNYGLRLDYVFATPALAQRVVEMVHDREPREWDRPSDHLPLRVRFEQSDPAIATRLSAVSHRDARNEDGTVRSESSDEAAVGDAALES